MRIPVGFYLCFRTGKTTDGPSFSACSFTWPTHRGGTPPRTLGVSHPTQPLPPLDGIKARQIDIRHRSRRVVQLPNLSSPKGHLHQQADGWKNSWPGGDIFVGEKKTLGEMLHSGKFHLTFGPFFGRDSPNLRDVDGHLLWSCGKRKLA